MRECRQCDVAAWFRGGSAEAKGRARRRWNEATNAGREMPWLGIIVATLYALEYESRIPTDRPPARSRRLPTPRYSNHVAIQGSITKLSGTTRPRHRRRRRPRRAFFPFRLRPTNGSRRAIERPPPSPFAFRTGTRKRSVFVILVILVQKPFPYLSTKRFRRRAHSFEIEPRRERGKGHHLVANGRINVSSYRGPGRGIGSTDAQVSERSASRF